MLDGGTKITGWQEYNDGIYVADIPVGTSFNMLYENGVMATKARYPNNSCLTVDKQLEKYSEDSVNTSFGYAKDSVIDGITDYDNLEVFMFPGGEDGVYNWFSHIYPVIGLDTSKRMISVDRTAYGDNVYYMGVGSRYYLQNDISFLDETGEFFVDKTIRI